MSFFEILHVNKHNFFEHNFLLKMLWLLKSIKDVQETHYCVCKRKFVVAAIIDYYLQPTSARL